MFNLLDFDPDGTVPYVITVGAMTDNRTPLDASDDAIASFSAASSIMSKVSLE